MEKLIVAGIDLSRILNVPYAGGRHPENTTTQEFLASLEQGGNCELFALAALRLAGFDIERKRSIELWHDIDFTEEIEDGGACKSFDIFFFLPKGADPHKVEEEVLRNFSGNEDTFNSLDLNTLKKFHLGIYVGVVENNIDCILHLPKPGPSAIWPLSYFEKSEKEYWLFKIKRPFKSSQ